METNEMIKIAVAALNDKKAQEIQLIKIRDLTIISDYFLIASGTSSTQVKTLADEVETKLSEMGVEPHHIEGKSTSWILLDYNTFVVHIFHTQSREFYQLERLWNDGEQIDIEHI